MFETEQLELDSDSDKVASRVKVNDKKDSVSKIQQKSKASNQLPHDVRNFFTNFQKTGTGTSAVCGLCDTTTTKPHVITGYSCNYWNYRRHIELMHGIYTKTNEVIQSDELNRGRTKGTVWQHFNTIDNQTFCNFCQKNVSPQAGRLKNHLDKCSAYRGAGVGDPVSSSTSGTAGTGDKKSLEELETQIILLQKSITKLQRTIENIKIWVSNSYDVDIPEECFVDEKIPNTININSIGAEDFKCEPEDEGLNENENEVEDNYFNCSELIDECYTKKEVDENASNLLNDDMIQIQNDSNDNINSTSREMNKDYNYSDDQEFELPETEEDDDDSDLDYGKRRRISQRKKKSKNYNFTNSKCSSSTKCRICKKVFSSISYLNFIHMPTHSNDEHVQKKPKTTTGGKGKPKSDIWQYFNTTNIEQVDGNFLKVAICYFCGLNVSAQAPRLKKHLNFTCPGSASKIPTLSNTSLTHSTSIATRKLGLGGKIKSSVWQFFTTSKNQNEDGKIVEVSVCNFCKCTVSSQAPRLRNHIQKCPENVSGSISTTSETGNKKPKQIPTYKATIASEDNRIALASKYVNIPKPLVNDDGSPLFYCSQETCNRSFQTLKNLKQHLKRIHNIPPISRSYEKSVNININPESNDNTRPETYMCTVCGKILKIGSKRAHDSTHSKKKKHRCDQCPAAFNRYQYLRIHRNIHTRLDVRICQHCGKEFIRLESLKLHQNTVHNDVRSFICEFPNCDKSYKIKRQLVLHQRAVHIVEKPYKCNLCSTKSFHTELGLKDHLLRSHKNEQEQLF